MKCEICHTPARLDAGRPGTWLNHYVCPVCSDLAIVLAVYFAEGLNQFAQHADKFAALQRLVSAAVEIGKTGEAKN